ncbi:MAG: alanine racemase [Marmoricola sp.]
MNEMLDDVSRHRLARRLNGAAAQLDDAASPVVVVDLDAFDANATDLVRRAAGKPIRLASKSVRIPALIERALAREGFSGVLAYQLREALWLVAEGVTEDAVMGYPSVDRVALEQLVANERSLACVTLMVDDPAQLDVVESLRRGSTAPLRVAIDIDAGLRLGPRTSVPSGPRCTTPNRSSTSLGTSPPGPVSGWWA